MAWQSSLARTLLSIEELILKKQFGILKFNLKI